MAAVEKYRTKVQKIHYELIPDTDLRRTVSVRLKLLPDVLTFLKDGDLTLIDDELSTFHTIMRHVPSSRFEDLPEFFAAYECLKSAYLDAMGSTGLD